MTVYNSLEKFTNTDFSAQISISLSEMLDRTEKYPEALECLISARSILEENYGQEDRRTCKVKRNIALLYLKCNSYEEALNELREVEELEIRLYGDRSLNLARTYKILGTIFTAQNQPNEARDFLMRAYSIFEQRGHLKMQKEVKQKLKQLAQSQKQAAALAALEIKEQQNSGDESPNEGKILYNARPGSIGAAKKKSKKKSAGVQKNNYMLHD